jgi:hypothetical protein
VGINWRARAHASTQGVGSEAMAKPRWQHLPHCQC